MMNVLRPALVLFVVLTALTGAVYPLAVTAVAQVVFPRQANGSKVFHNGQPVGSELIGQHFTDSRYFWGRPSATAAVPYDGASSSGSNLGPTNPDLIKNVTTRLDELRKAHPDQTEPPPVDLVTASASGLDPHISPAAAEYQVMRVAKARGLDVDHVRQLIQRCTEPRTLGILGEPRVNVLLLNLALDQANAANSR